MTVRARGADGEVHTQFCEPIGHRQVNGDYVESWQQNLGGQGIFGVALFVKGDQVWFSEVSPRPHDTGMVTMVTQWQNEFELHARAILGLPVDTTPGIAWRQRGDLRRGGRRRQRLRRRGPAVQVPHTDIRLFGKPESFITRRMGVALAFDDDVDTARRNAIEAAGRVTPRAV